MSRSKEIKKRIYDIIDGFPKPINEIKEQIGFSYNTISYYLLRLTKEGKISEKEISGIKMYYVPVDYSCKKENELNVDVE